MANPEHFEMLLRGAVEAWNKWRNENPTIQPDLSEADLREADLRQTSLSRANLREADLSGADLSESDLAEADLGDANLQGASLYRADLTRAILTHADLRGANLSEANLSGADLSEANLSAAILFDTDLTRASCLQTNFAGAALINCIVYGIAAWDVNLDDAKQADLHITPLWDDASITVDNLEVAQFLYLLLHNEKMRSVLDTITSKVVLILGRFSSERKPILDALREALRSHSNGYIPVLFDFEPQTDKPILETVKTLANLARFVIADLTDPNMVRSELTYITAQLPTVPVQPIIQRDAKLPTEFSTWKHYQSFLPVYEYADLSHLLASLGESVITPAEGHVQARRL